MDNQEVTQENVNSAVHEARQSWEKMVADSGSSQTLFIATNKKATQFLADYTTIQLEVKKLGLDMPDLIDGVKVSFPDVDGDCNEKD